MSHMSAGLTVAITVRSQRRVKINSGPRFDRPPSWIDCVDNVAYLFISSGSIEFAYVIEVYQ